MSNWFEPTEPKKWWQQARKDLLDLEARINKALDAYHAARTPEDRLWRLRMLQDLEKAANMSMHNYIDLAKRCVIAGDFDIELMMYNLQKAIYERRLDYLLHLYADELGDLTPGKHNQRLRPSDHPLMKRINAVRQALENM